MAHERKPKLFDVAMDFDGNDHRTPLTVVGLLSYSIYQVGLGQGDALDNLIEVLNKNESEVRW